MESEGQVTTCVSALQPPDCMAAQMEMHLPVALQVVDLVFRVAVRERPLSGTVTQSVNLRTARGWDYTSCDRIGAFKCDN